MSSPDRQLPLDFQLETQGGGSRRRVTHLVHDPALPPSAPPRLETWERSRVIGEGGQGIVLLQKCISRGPRENAERALKVIRCVGPEGDKARYVSELGTMARFSHERYSKYFVKMLGWYFSKGRGDLCIALDYLPLGDLQTFVEKHGPLAEQDAQLIVSQVLHGLGIMHEAGFAHRDVKPQNILIQQHPSSDGTSPWWVKLADFGISKSVDATITAVSIGSHLYMAPELFCPPTEYHKIDLRLADMWSVGATAFFLLTKQIFREEKDSSTNEFLETRGTRDFPSALKFVLTATIPDPSYRLGWKEASSHSWVASYKLAFSVLPSEEVEQDDDGSSTSSGSSGSTVDEPSDQRGLTTEESRLTEMSLTAIPANIPLTTVLTPADARDTAGLNQKDDWQRIGGEESDRKTPKKDASVGRVQGINWRPRDIKPSKIPSKFDLDRLDGTEFTPRRLAPLLQAALMGDLADAGALVSDGADIEQQDWKHGVTALWIAAYYGHLDVVKFLTDRGAKSSVCGPYDTSPLDEAERNGHVEVAVFIEDLAPETSPQRKGPKSRKFQPRLKYPSADSSSRKKPQNITLHKAAAQGDADMIRVLVASGAQVNGPDRELCTPLHAAAMFGKTNAIRALISLGANVNAMDQRYRTPLATAALSGSLWAIKMLSRSGADVDTRDVYGDTPLHLAARNGSPEPVTRLFDLGCDVEAINNNGMSAKDIARIQGHMDVVKLFDTFSTRVSAGRDDRYNIKSDTDHNEGSKESGHEKSDARTPGVRNLFRYLFKNTINTGGLDRRDRALALHSRTAAVNRDLDWESGHEESDAGTPEMRLEELQFLVSMRFDLAKPDKMRNESGQTALHVAAQKGSLEAAEILVRNGANINRLDSGGASPLWTAATYGNFSVAEYLVAQGAKRPLEAPAKPTFANENIKDEHKRVSLYLTHMDDGENSALARWLGGSV